MAGMKIMVLILFTLVMTLDAWENLPSIPAGRRAEYYLLHDDGAYKFGYDTGDGQSAVVNADAKNEVQGKYSYRDVNGKSVGLSYTAGENGFVPSLDGTSIAAGNSRSGEVRSKINFEQETQDNSDYKNEGDASYSFTIDTDTYKRTETSDSKGNINGQYSYNSPNGGVNYVKFITGPKNGFLSTDENVNPGSNSAKAGDISRINILSNVKSSNNIINPDGSYSFSYNTPEQTREESADAANNVHGSYTFKSPDNAKFHHVEYKAGADTGFVAQGAHIPNNSPSIEHTSLISPQTSKSSDISHTMVDVKSLKPNDSGKANGYSFSYSANDHSHQQSADSQNNVVGSFSFRTPDDNQLRHVDYRAGAATGFIASGSHLPKDLNALHSGVSQQSEDDSVIVGNTNLVSSKSQENLNDRSYSFSYKTADQSRVETSDSQGNIEGSFSFVAPDGQNRITDYQAGSRTGFIATGSHLPSANQNLKHVVPTSSYSKTISLLPSEAPHISPKSVINNDGSYSFSFSTPDQSREEHADAQNNVHGSYSFKTVDDGKIHKVDYKSGSKTGFIAQGDHLPTALSAISNEGQTNEYQKSLNNGNSFSSVSSKQITISNVPSRKISSLSSSNYPNIPPLIPDGSYSFSYDTGEQSRIEEGDSQGNVQGSFSFVAKDDGKLRKVEYEAGAEKGFVAKGEHLPVVPSVHESTASAIPSSSYLRPVLRNQETLSQTSFDSTNGQINGKNNDASYSYSYKTDTSSKQEQSDAQGNVVGSFSFIGGDGKSRNVHYTAKNDEGFIAVGDHLPKPISATQNVALIGTNSRSNTGAVVSSRESNDRTIERGTSIHNVQRYLPPLSPNKFGYVFDSNN